ncbi:hypothetical protein QBC41DRAFT_11119 [Cercophora samala]|uniref:Uncharacterized protein n=1 Tax=Cercophora samala TaxID=330535 RepID=A0AA40D9K8_9PEZI|nr:hypothetical protein QBC41DRAFT_11119 [Cercophora samala]
MQALNLAELPQKEDDGRAQQQQQPPHHQQQYQQQQQQQPQQPPPSGSPGLGTNSLDASTRGLVNGGGDYGRQHDGDTPMRQNTTSSTTTVASLASLATEGTTPTPYSLETHTPSSPSLATAQAAAQAVFSARDGADLTAQRRASRRRTGPLNPEQREKASLIRKMGACGDCKRRRVACHPSHHNTTWDALTKKYGHGSPSSANGRLLSPAVSSFKSILVQDPEEMEVEPTPFSQQQLHQVNPQDSRIRTPLPSGPRPERPTSMIPVAGLESFRVDLQGSASRILASPLRSRYASVSAMLVRWQDDEDTESRNDLEKLARMFKDDYNYSVKIKYIPTSGDPGNSSYLWLNREVNTFVTSHNQRDTLKIFYYSGYSYLGEDRDTMISSSKKATPDCDIPWKMIQGMFENICSDALIILDCAYYPVYQTVRRQGMLEVIAASAGEDHMELLGRSTFTRALTLQLKLRAAQKFKDAYSASELHARLVSLYPTLVRHRSPELETITTFPTPLFVQLSGTKVLPSILLAPLVVRPPSGDMTPTTPFTPDSPAAGTSHISLTFQIADENTFNTESWAEWLRSMPQGIRDLKVDGPYRNTPWTK